MKNLLLVLALVTTIPFAIYAQNPPAPPQTYAFGNRIVRVPMPDGFAEITSQFPTLAARFRATEGSGNDLLSFGVPKTFIPKLQINEDIDLEFYTKASAVTRLRSMDVTPANFAELAATLEKNFGSFIDPDGAVMKNAEKNSTKGLTELLGRDTPVDINGTTNLGFIEKSPKVFSGMLLMNFEIYGRKMTTLGTMSILHVNNRLVSVSVYRMMPDQNSIRELTDFTKKWTAKIVAANK